MKKTDNRKNLLVTLANEAYIDQAKQLFSSVYWNAGWEGDYMLLAYEIPEEKLKWFRDKGILVKKCESIPDAQNFKNIKHHPLVFSKFYLFLLEFKKWKNIVYLDTDIIVRASLDDLTMVNGLGAVPELWNNKLFHQIVPNYSDLLKYRLVYKKTFNRLLNEFKKNYRLEELAFNSGVMAFSTDVIKEDTFSELNNLFEKYSKISFGVDQLIFNLFFYKKWKRLPWVYNLCPGEIQYRGGLKPEDVKGIVLHFIHFFDLPKAYKPWDINSPFLKEWQNNLQRANLINLKTRPLPRKRWSNPDIQLCIIYLRFKIIINFYIHIIGPPRLKILNFRVQKINSFFELVLRPLGSIEIFLKKHNPNLYFKLKKLKISQNIKINNNKKNLLVTLANEAYIDQAKQLFSSVYWNAGWEGDYMLLAYEIPEEKLKWFRDKGILVKKCESIPDAQNFKNIKHHPLVFSKFYLFLLEFKKWKNIVYLDTDIIVRNSLDKLTRIKRFAAPKATGINLRKEFYYSQEPSYKELTDNYPLTGAAFNTGIFAFNTDIIKKDSFFQLTELIRRYGALSIYSEEPILNLFFYKKWEKLSWIYNLYPTIIQYKYHINEKDFSSLFEIIKVVVILHFVKSVERYKPWEKQSLFYKEWRDNLIRAELINLKEKPPVKEKLLSDSDIKPKIRRLKLRGYYVCLKLRFIIYYIPRQIDKLLGLIGIFIRKHSPNLYFKIKKLKKKIYNKKIEKEIIV